MRLWKLFNGNELSAHLQTEDECNNSKQKETEEGIDDGCGQVIIGLFIIADTSDCGRLGNYCLQENYGSVDMHIILNSVMNHALTGWSILDSKGEDIGI
jgi:hypothetical protein